MTDQDTSALGIEGEQPWRIVTPEEYAQLRLKGRYMVERDYDGLGGVAIWFLGGSALPGAPTAARYPTEAIVCATEAEQEFADRQPDYWEAVAYLKRSRAREYQVLGASPDQAVQWVDAEAIQTAHEMLSRGQDPASGWYALAKARGFIPSPAPNGDQT